MEITAIPMSGVPQFTASPVVKAISTDPTPIPVPQPAVPQAQVAAPVADTAAAATPDLTQQAEEEARQAALSFKNFYAVSDTASSVFKDVTGEYITRSVNLRDGTVTYTPQPQYVRPLNAGISINA